MQQQTAKLLLILFITTTGLHCQNTETNRLIKGELKITFPGIYFKNNSLGYAAMPYTVDYRQHSHDRWFHRSPFSPSSHLSIITLSEGD